MGVEEEVPVPAVEVAEICEEPVDEKIEIVDEIEPDSDEEIEELVLSSEAEDEAVGITELLCILRLRVS